MYEPPSEIFHSLIFCLFSPHSSLHNISKPDNNTQEMYILLNMDVFTFTCDKKNNQITRLKFRF